MAFMVLGAADYIAGGRLGLGGSFADGFRAMGPLALGMAGINCLSPLLGGVVTGTIGRLFALFGADPVMAAAVFLSIDTGGYALAHTMTQNAEAANFSAIILGSMLGPVVTFAIPVGLSYTPAEDRKLLALGTLCGILCIPFACTVGGLSAGYPAAMVLSNLTPVFLLAGVVALGLALAQELMFRVFAVLSKLVVGVVVAALAAAILSEETGLTILAGMAPLSESFVIIGRIAIVLAGAYPMAEAVRRAFRGGMARLGRWMRVGPEAVNGLIACCINSIPAYGMLAQMDERGKVVNYAFACCAAFALGDHLAFCAGVEPGMVVPMLCAKLSGGVLCIAAAELLYPVWKKNQEKKGIS